MPATPRLSRKFHDTFGQDMADELGEWFSQVYSVYRTELRDLNELNFGRFDATLKQQAAEADAKWGRRFAELDSKWERRLTELDTKWEGRITEFSAKWEERIADLDTKWERRLADLDTKWEGRLAALETRMTRWMFGFWVTAVGIMMALTKL